MTVTGIGTTLNLSSDGIAFVSDQTFIPGIEIQLSIDWPAQLHGKTRIMLVAEGTVVRIEGKVAAVEIRRYEFRTQKK